MTPTLFFVIGVLMLVLGIAGLSFVNRNKFYRRTLLSVEAFAGYGKMMTARSRENRIETASRLLIVFGLVTAIAAYIKL